MFQPEMPGQASLELVAEWTWTTWAIFPDRGKILHASIFEIRKSTDRYLILHPFELSRMTEMG